MPSFRPTAALAAAAAALVACRLAIAAPQERSPSFGEHALWDDGKAEVSRYAAEEIVEGGKRSFTAWSVVVAERFDPAAMVKSDGFALDQVAVLKCNWFLRVPTGVYDYHQMASLFVRRADGLAMKAAFSSQEWCGTTFALWRRDVAGFETRSYFDGEGDRRHPLDDLPTNALFWEQVPLWIRGRHPERPRTEKVTLVAKRLATARCPPPELVAASIAFDGPQRDAGGRLQARLLVGERADALLFQPEFPHVLDEWRRADGTTWRLERSARVAYWKADAAAFAELMK